MSVANDIQKVKIPYEQFWQVWESYIAECKEDVGSGEHACQDCSQRFEIKEALDIHRSRRELLARLPCGLCNVAHLCYNICTLNEQRKKCNVYSALIYITALTKRYCGVNLADVKVGELPDSDALSVEEKCIFNICCAICTEPIAEGDTLEKHMTAPSQSSYPQCTFCKKHLPNNCALTAHKRIHDHTGEMVCPECGKRCKHGDWQRFEQHVMYYCHHGERILCYQCPTCPAVLLSNEELGGHIVDAHIQMLHKCGLCPLAFKDHISFGLHRDRLHPVGKVVSLAVYKCPMCEACVFADTDVLSKHFAAQHVMLCAKSAFRCATCSCLFPSKAQLMDHVRKDHQHVQRLGESLDGDVNISETTKIIRNTTPTATATTTMGGRAPTPPPSRKRPLTPPPTSKPRPPTPPPYSEPTSAPKSFTCTHCNLTSNDRVTFQEHIQKHRARNSFQCPECGICFTVELSLKKHLVSVHHVSDPEAHLNMISNLVGKPINSKDDQPLAAVEQQQQRNTLAVNPHAQVSIQCSVCKRRFLTEKLLMSHMRTHGMAFLRNYKYPTVNPTSG